jgi:hypothetical protein
MIGSDEESDEEKKEDDTNTDDEGKITEDKPTHYDPTKA